MWIDRRASHELARAVQQRPVVLLTGPRQTGKTSLLRAALPNHTYLTLDRTATARSAREAPAAFLAGITGGAVIDEVQYAPELFSELKIDVDTNRRAGRWVLTGSQRFHLMRSVSESLAGRIHIQELFTLSQPELRSSGYFDQEHLDRLVWRGGYPETWTTDLDLRSYFDSYVQTYLQRDLREFINVSNLRDFATFVRGAAVRAGQLLNYSGLSRDVGVSVNTIKAWITALEAGGIVYLLPPYSRNLGKRLTKAPKLYFADNGLLCHLLGASNEAWDTHVHAGQIWENFVFSELLKSGHRPGTDLFFYRDQNGVEVDFMSMRDGELTLVEAKSAEDVDGRKLPFHKVAPLFDEPTQCLVACRVRESGEVPVRGHALINPLRREVLPRGPG